MGLTREELQQKIAEAIKETDQYKIQFYQSQLNALSGQEEEKDAKHRELQELVLGYNFNELFGNTEANKIIHKLLYDEAEKHLATAAEKDTQITSLSIRLAQVESEREAAKADLAKVREVANADLSKLQEEYELTRKDALYQLNEANRYKQQVKTLEQQLETERKARKDLTPSKDLAAMIEDAKAAKQQKRQLINIRKLDERGSRYAGEDENGNTVEFSWLEQSTVEEVKEFPLQPLKMPTDVTPEALDAAFQSVDGQEAVVRADGGGEDVQAAPEPLETAGDAEAGVTLELLHQRLKVVEDWKKLFESQASTNRNEPVVAMF